MVTKRGNKSIVGVLGLQGNFQEHLRRFTQLGCEVRDVRRTSQLGELDALVLPGGESTAVAILERSESELQVGQAGIFEEIRNLSNQGLPIWGTCMGSILLAKEIEGSEQGRLSLMDIRVRRNAFGPQRYSSEVPLAIPTLGEVPFPGILIRAPLITHVGADVQTLSAVTEGIVMARQRNLLATVFHPEAVDDTRVHEYFLSMID